MKAQIVSFHCVLKNNFGQVLSSSVNHDVLTGTGSTGQGLVALGHALENLTTGEKRKVSLKASEAYGFYDPKKVMTLSRESLPQLQGARTPETSVQLEVDGERKSYRVVEMTNQKVTLDGNHPFAGQDLIFEIETIAARDATPEEISDAAPPMANAAYH